MLLRPKFGFGPEFVEDLIAYLMRKAGLVTPSQGLAVVRQDPSDDKFLEAALEAGAECLVTGDPHLLRLQEFRGLRIVTVRVFLEDILSGD